MQLQWNDRTNILYLYLNIIWTSSGRGLTTLLCNQFLTKRKNIKTLILKPLCPDHCWITLILTWVDETFVAITTSMNKTGTDRISVSVKPVHMQRNRFFCVHYNCKGKEGSSFSSLLYMLPKNCEECWKNVPVHVNMYWRQAVDTDFRAVFLTSAYAHVLFFLFSEHKKHNEFPKPLP